MGELFHARRLCRPVCVAATCDFLDRACIGPVLSSAPVGSDHLILDDGLADQPCSAADHRDRRILATFGVSLVLQEKLRAVAVRPTSRANSRALPPAHFIHPLLSRLSVVPAGDRHCLLGSYHRSALAVFLQIRHSV